MTDRGFFPDRLVWARKRSGYNQSSLAKLVGMDARTLRGYESGEYSPPVDTIERLSTVLEVPSAYFCRGPLVGPEVQQASFRSLSKMTAAKRDMALARGAFAFELASWLNSVFNLPRPDVPSLRDSGDPESAAMALRSAWGLGTKPLGNLVHLLEAKGVRVFSLAVDAREVDAFSTWHDNVPFVFVNTRKTAAHGRFDCAHELAHLVLHRHGDYDGRVSELEADRFASAFLMPAEDVVASAPRFPTLDALLKAKKRWGVSLPALTFRMHEVGVLSEWHYRTLFRQMSALGLRTKEIDDERRERSSVIEWCLAELRKDGLGLDGIAEQVGLGRRDIQELVFDLATIAVDGGVGVGPRKARGRLHIVVDNGRKAT